MFPWLSRHLICPLHERLVGRDTLRLVRELEASQWWSPDELAELQREKLRALLEHARANVPFYRRRLHEAHVDPRCDNPFEALRRLPTLEKCEIRANKSEMAWRHAPGGLHRHNTGGSTGQPLTFFIDRRRQACDQAGRIRTHRWFNVDLGDRELWLWGSPVEHGKADRLKQWRDRLFNHRLLNAFNMSAATMDAYLAELNRFKPACLFGYPSSIAHLVEHGIRGRESLFTDNPCDHRGESRGEKRLPTPSSLRAVFVTGEVCYPHQREVISEYFGVPVADGYGSRDAGFVAHQCEEGAMHVMAENLIVEIIEDGKPVPTGREGEIVITHLDAYAMPFIRYRTGDRGRLRAGRCSCGRGLPMMESVQGRQTDFVYLPDGSSKHALCVIYVMRDVPEVARFRVTQRADFGLNVEIVPDAGARASFPQAIEAALRRTMNDAVDVSVRLVDRIDCDQSGKYRHVISYARPPVGKGAGALSEPQAQARGIGRSLALAVPISPAACPPPTPCCARDGAPAGDGAPDQAAPVKEESAYV